MALFIKLMVRTTPEVFSTFINPLRHASSSVPSGTQGLTQIIHHKETETKGIVELCLNRPAARNALNKVLVEKILTQVELISNSEDVRCVLFRSHVQGIFCAGADLKERLSLPEHHVSKVVSRLRLMTSRIASIPVPVIAVLEGNAYGGGLEIALACDIRVGASGVEMGLVETKLAIIPGAGGTQRLPRIVGVPMAKELIYTGRTLKGPEALACGLLNHLVPQNPENNAAYLSSLHIAKQIVRNGPIAVRAAKEAIDTGARMDAHTAQQVEALCYERVVKTRDRIEGLESFVRKRDPEYKGN